MIGPNAILQLLPVLDDFDLRAGLLARAGIAQVPDGTKMIPERHAARLHRQMRRDMPDRAAELAARAGVNTADYILAHRIPKPAQFVLRCLPAGLAARVLSRAIAQHAWTFAGSGGFTVVNPWRFALRDNPLIRGEINADCLCDWHAAVFARLYQALVARDCTCVERQCGAQGGGVCRFEIKRG